MAAILLFATALRLIFFAGFQWSDDFIYISHARALLEGEYTFNLHHSFRLGIILPIALFQQIFGVSIFSCVLYNFISSILYILITYFICKVFFQISTALIASFLVAILPVNIYLSTTAFSDLPFGLFCAAAFYLLISSDKSSASLLAGLSLGIAYLTRETVIFFVVFLAIFLLIKTEYRKRIILCGVTFISVIVLEALLYLAFAGDPFYRYTHGIKHSHEGALNWARYTPTAEILESVTLGNLSMLFNPLSAHFTFFGVFYILLATSLIYLIVIRGIKHVSIFVIWCFTIGLCINFFPISVWPYLPALPAGYPRFFEAITIPTSIIIAYFLWTSHETLRIRIYIPVVLSLLTLVMISCSWAIKRHSDSLTINTKKAYAYIKERRGNQKIISDYRTSLLMRFLNAYKGDLSIKDFEQVKLREVRNALIVIDKRNLNIIRRLDKYNPPDEIEMPPPCWQKVYHFTPSKVKSLRGYIFNPFAFFRTELDPSNELNIYWIQ